MLVATHRRGEGGGGGFGAPDVFEWSDYEALIADVERLYAAVPLCGRYGSEYPSGPIVCLSGSNEPFLALLRDGIDSWKGTQLEWAQNGQIPWTKWESDGKALGDACAKIAEIDSNNAYTIAWITTAKAQVTRDVKAVIVAAQKLPTAAAEVLGGALIVAAIIFALTR